MAAVRSAVRERLAKQESDEAFSKDSLMQQAASYLETFYQVTCSPLIPPLLWNLVTAATAAASEALGRRATALLCYPLLAVAALGAAALGQHPSRRLVEQAGNRETFV